MTNAKVVPTAQALDVRGTLKQGIALLNAAAVPSVALSAELLLMHVLGRDRTWLYTHAEDALDQSPQEKYFAWIARRAAGEPTQYIIAKQEFWGLEFEVTPAVLIPRPETEHLIEVAIERLGPRRHDPLRIADIGTGSGCIAVALAKQFPNAEIIATDISPAALDVARRNATRHGIANRIEFIAADLLEPMSSNMVPSSSHPFTPNEHEGPPSASRGSSHIRSSSHSPLATSHFLFDSQKLFDLILSNPPYIATKDAPDLQREVRDHEPPQALFAGPTGLEIYARLVEQAESRLAPNGFLILELGYGASEQVRALLETRDRWQHIAIANDLAGIPRVLSASLH